MVSVQTVVSHRCYSLTTWEPIVALPPQYCELVDSCLETVNLASHGPGATTVTDITRGRPLFTLSHGNGPLLVSLHGGYICRETGLLSGCNLYWSDFNTTLASLNRIVIKK